MSYQRAGCSSIADIRIGFHVVRAKSKCARRLWRCSEYFGVKMTGARLRHKLKAARKGAAHVPQSLQNELRQGLSIAFGQGRKEGENEGAAG